MSVKYKLMPFQDVLNSVNTIINNKYMPERYLENSRESILQKCKDIIEIEELKDNIVIEDIIVLYEAFYKGLNEGKEILSETNTINNIKTFVENQAKKGYASIRLDYESYNIKTLMYYIDENYKKNIAYMAGSFYTDQEYRAFLANIQKGINKISFAPLDNTNRIYDLRTIKNGYISRVKKAINHNTQDGYHADFVLDNNRFFLLRKDDNPVDTIYNWIERNTQAGVLEEWKTYLYNQLSEDGHIIKCNVTNYTNVTLKGLVLSDEVNTELIRNIRKEGMALGEISIPRKAIDLDPSMSFIDAMTKFIIPHINERKHLYNVGDPLSKIIESPIIYRQGNKLKKTYLYPRQKVMAQGLLNSIKEGRNNLILNGGMGIGKTFIACKLAYSAIREHFKKNSGKISVFCQSHIIPKWERQFSEALPDVPLKFIQINNYKDVMDLEHKEPEGIEIYLLPKDKVKRNYLIEFSSNSRFKLSSNFYKVYKEIVEGNNKDNNIFIVNSIKPSEMKILNRRVQNKLGKWTCMAKEVFNDEGSPIGYKVTTTSKLLEKKFGKSNKYYDFYVDNLDRIFKYKEILDEEDITISSKTYFPRITCPTCGGSIFNREEDQLSEDDCDLFLTKNPKTKSNRNNKCLNYIKVDGTPLTERERKLIMKDEIDYIVDNDETHPYIDDDNNPITEQEELRALKDGKYDQRYTIVIKKCNSPMWTAADRKGYRVVNSIDMLRKKFGDGFFDISIADESHLYSAQSAQGAAFSNLCKMSKINLALTGTLTGGKSSHMFYTLYRMIPHKMSKHYKYEEISKFIDHYGRRKKVTKEYQNNDKYNKSGQGKITSSGWNEIPGISPMLYSHFLADIMMSRKIEDMGFDMPELNFYKHDIEMTRELQEGYDHLKNDILSFMSANKELNLGGTYLNALLSYPDAPLNEPLMYKDMLISNPIPIDTENQILPKERRLIDIIKRNLLEGRRSLVYVTYTGEKAVDRRVEKVLKKVGLKVAVLKSSVNTEKREQWIEDRHKEGVEVIITNPKIVQTGLDIVQYPTIIFFQLDYDVRIVRQAESRAWRVGQEKECKVYYMTYTNTMQYDALKLIGSKKKASLALEGVFSEDILSASGDDLGDSGAAALYKSLLGQVTLKEDDLDFFSEEEIIEIFDEDEIIKPIISKPIAQTIGEEGQISLFTITKENLTNISNKKKKKLINGQVSMFQL